MKTDMTRLRIVFISLSSFVLLGCTTQPIREQPEESLQENSGLDFIEIGSTTRVKILEELGEPFLQFDEERIYAYYLIEDRIQNFGGPVTWSTDVTSPGGYIERIECMQFQPHICATQHQLMLVFDSRGILTRYSYLRGAAER